MDARACLRYVSKKCCCDAHTHPFMHFKLQVRGALACNHFPGSSEAHCVAEQQEKGIDFVLKPSMLFRKPVV